MKKKLIAAILTGAMLVAGMSTGVWAESEKSFVYGTTGYSEEMGDAGLNPHDNYSGWSKILQWTHYGCRGCQGMSGRSDCSS